MSKKPESWGEKWLKFKKDPWASLETIGELEMFYCLSKKRINHNKIWKNRAFSFQTLWSAPTCTAYKWTAEKKAKKSFFFVKP